MLFQNLAPVTKKLRQAVTPELAAKTSRQSSNGLELSSGAQIAKMRQYLHSTAALRHDLNQEHVKISPTTGHD
jgi:hypothetical protein